MRSRRAHYTEAGVKDVLTRIIKKIRDKSLVDRLTNKVVNYFKTKQDKDDLTLPESSMIYRDVDYGDILPLSKRQKVDIDWSNHAEYRSQLRDVNPDMVNRVVQERLRRKLPKPDRKKVNFKEPGVGTIVVDYDMKKKPAEADIITVWK